jgi:hypothetical protein
LNGDPSFSTIAQPLQSAGAINTPSYDQVSEKLTVAPLGRWRRYRAAAKADPQGPAAVGGKAWLLGRVTEFGRYKCSACPESDTSIPPSPDVLGENHQFSAVIAG